MENRQMSNKMKLILENWSNYLNEEEETQIKEIETVGDLKAAIKAATLAIRDPKAKGAMGTAAASLTVALLKDAIPGANTIGMALEAGLGVGGVLKAIYGTNDSKNVSKGLQSLNVDDELSAVVDDKVEMQFLNYLSKRIKEVPDETKLVNFNVNELLSAFIKKTYDNTTVKK